MNTDDDLNFGSLLRRFDLSPVQSTRLDPNIFQISGFPRRETVASNVWAYFLDPSESHNMGTLFLEAFEACIDRKSEAAGKGRISLERTEATVFSVAQEYSEGSPTRNRLDILVRSANTVIGIENKVDAELYNPLDDYREKIRNAPVWSDEMQSDSEGDIRTERLVILHQKSLDRSDLELINEDPDLLEVSYDEFFEEILRRIGTHLMDAHPRATELFHQFVENFSEERNMRNLEELDAAIGQFLRQVAGSEQQFFALRRSLRSYLDGCNQKLSDVDTIVEQRFDAAPVTGYTYGLKHPKLHGEERRIRAVDGEIRFAQWHEHMLTSIDSSERDIYFSVFMPIDAGFDRVTDLDLSEIICCAGRDWNNADPTRTNARLGVRITDPPEEIAEVIFSRINGIVAEQEQSIGSFFYLG